MKVKGKTYRGVQVDVRVDARRWGRSTLELGSGSGLGSQAGSPGVYHVVRPRTIG